MMSIKELLEADHSKGQAQKVADLVVQDTSRLEELMGLFFSEDLRTCQRAAWSMGLLGAKHPQLLIPYVREMILKLKNPLHDAVVRNTLRTWKEMDFSDELEGDVFDIAFKYLSSPKYPIAVHVFAMMVCSRIAQKYPELAEELIPVIEEQYPHGSAGFKSRARKELKKLRGL